MICEIGLMNMLNSGDVTTIDFDIDGKLLETPQTILLLEEVSEEEYIKYHKEHGTYDFTRYRTYPGSRYFRFTTD